MKNLRCAKILTTTIVTTTLITTGCNNTVSEPSELKMTLESLETENQEKENKQEWNIDELYVINYKMLYEDSELEDEKNFYQIITEKDFNEIESDGKCIYLKGEAHSNCFQTTYQTIEEKEDIIYKEHFLYNEGHYPHIILEINSPRKDKTINLDELENDDILESLITPLAQKIKKEDYQSYYTEEGIHSLTEKMNQKDYFSSNKQKTY